MQMLSFLLKYFDLVNLSEKNIQNNLLMNNCKIATVRFKYFQIKHKKLKLHTEPTQLMRNILQLSFQ